MKLQVILALIAVVYTVGNATVIHSQRKEILQLTRELTFIQSGADIAASEVNACQTELRNRSEAVRQYRIQIDAARAELSDKERQAAEKHVERAKAIDPSSTELENIDRMVRRWLN